MSGDGYCECPLAGYCEKHGYTKTTREHEMCQGINLTPKETRDYRLAWEQGTYPGRTSEPVAMVKASNPTHGQRATAPNARRHDGEKPGSELRTSLTWFGAGSSCCGQVSHVGEMDRRGCDWCEKNIDMIAEWIAEDAAGARVSEYSDNTNPEVTDAVKMIARQAIANARAKAAAAKVELALRKSVVPHVETKWWEPAAIQQTQRDKATAFIATIPEEPDAFTGRGIVITGGGRYFASAYVTIRVIRHVGCTLPIELWHLEGEMDAEMCELLRPYNVTIRDASKHADGSGYFIDHWWKGWQLKAYALRHSSFAEVLMLDADCYPVRDPSFIFDWQPYQQTGAIFWPDINSSSRLFPREAAESLGVPSFIECPTESGQLVVNKSLRWREVELAKHYNAEANYVYHIIYGDKDTFPTAWHRLGTAYSRMCPHSNSIGPGILQLDHQCQVLFNHRVHDKFRVNGTKFDSTRQRSGANNVVKDWKQESFCHSTLKELVRLWKHK